MPHTKKWWDEKSPTVKAFFVWVQINGKKNMSVEITKEQANTLAKEAFKAGDSFNTYLAGDAMFVGIMSEIT